MTLKPMFVAAVLLSARLVAAQTVTLNPTKVTFTPSADHDAVIGTAPAVTSYQFDAVAMNGVGAIAISRSLGKPTPVAGSIVVVVPELLTVTKNTVYTGTVTAIGPGGNTPSAVSNPFAVPGPPRAPTGVLVN